MPVFPADGIQLLYDPYAIPLAKEDLTYTPSPEDIPEGAIFAGVEFDGFHGRIIFQLYAVLNPSFLTEECLAPLGEVKSIQMNETDETWELILRGDDIHTTVSFTATNEQVECYFAASNVPLSGRPNAQERVEIRAANAARAAEEG